MVDLNDLVNAWLGIVFDYVRSLVNYKIVDGVNFFAVLMAIGVFSIIVHFFFVKIASFGNGGAIYPARVRYSVPGFIRGRKR